MPELNGISKYYRGRADDFKTWFKVTRFDAAPRDVMADARVVSSRKPLAEVSKHSMSPYYRIECPE